MSRITKLILTAALLTFVAAGCKKGTKLEPATDREPAQERKVDDQEGRTPKPTTGDEVTKSALSFQIIYFDFDRYNLRSDAIAALNDNAKAMMDNSGLRIKIEGHCDERGTVEYNLALGEKRALASKEYLVKLGISPSRVEIISYGKEKPVDMRSSEDAWAKNRRDEFKIVSQ